MSLLRAQTSDLKQLESAGRLRGLAPRVGADFASNDYLGLAESLELAEAAKAALERGVSVGSGGSRLLRGNHPQHEVLEAEAARFFGREAALFMPTGFAANTTLFATLPQTGDLIVHDALIHASTHEGLRLTRAETRSAVHNDAGAFDDAIADWRAKGGTGQVWVAVESLYSMDGDFAPLADLADIAGRQDAVLVVDEAHATGVFGPGGRGLSAQLGARDNLITLHTCGKALGCEGALLCGPQAMRDHIVNRGRGFIFSTAPSPLTAAIARSALEICERSDRLREELTQRVERAKTLLEPFGAECHGSPIIPLVLGDDRRTMEIAEKMQQAGFDIRGIRPPSVPEGTGRLRIVMTLNTSAAELEAMADCLARALR